MILNVTLIKNKRVFLNFVKSVKSHFYVALTYLKWKIRSWPPPSCLNVTSHLWSTQLDLLFLSDILAHISHSPLVIHYSVWYIIRHVESSSNSYIDSIFNWYVFILGMIHYITTMVMPQSAEWMMKKVHVKSVVEIATEVPLIL